MSSVVIAGDTSGTVTLDAPAVAGSTVLTLPATSGTVVTDTATQTLTNKTLTSPVTAGTPTGVGVLTSGTAVASTSGTSIDFTGIPSWVKRITVMFNGVSTNGTSSLLIQLGDSGGIENTGYLGCGLYISTGGSTSAFTTGFGINTLAQVTTLYGSMIISLVDSSTNTWVEQGNFSSTNSIGCYSSGAKPLSATLDRVRITTVNGTDTFDAGSINILFE